MLEIRSRALSAVRFRYAGLQPGLCSDSPDVQDVCHAGAWRTILAPSRSLTFSFAYEPVVPGGLLAGTGVVGAAAAFGVSVFGEPISEALAAGDG